jgi:SAM-dependent methyltransferase
VVLADEVGKGPRPQALGERRDLVEPPSGCLGEEITHAASMLRSVPSDARAGSSSEVIYDRLAAWLEPVEEEIVRRLAPQEGERWLDLVSGTGAVAFRAARAGADVTGIDGAQPIVEKARKDAEEQGLSVRFDVGSVEYLPYDDDSFDVLVSNFGLVLAPDHANVAAELARVARPGARLGFTAWKPNPKLSELYRRFSDEPIEGSEAYEWGREDHAVDMLGDDFELDFHDGAVRVDASGEALWQIFSASAPAVTTLLERLDEKRGQDFHRAFAELYEEFQDDDGTGASRRYLLVLGRRR